MKPIICSVIGITQFQADQTYLARKNTTISIKYYSIFCTSQLLIILWPILQEYTQGRLHADNLLVYNCMLISIVHCIPNKYTTLLSVTCCP